ncbi:LysR family transcriptional regulator [Brachybacterium endophyticum]|uniref:LysR family transcriptional regulator n=1 Tax=Brachybacterium endophyticum TaxID=2182385 RepID=A0A2U2RMZ1_9MICO|nr:LysR family transcriptional regulator [Brachybacterium endophyticum]PWH07144.1 LysR family transcriptional regulator [Brachybacterium endophyticum]
MDLRQMEYVVALADERHFTRAAELAGISQSGLSSAIRSLERELGSTLFDRTTRRVEPTAAGFALLPHARTMLEEAARAREAVLRVGPGIGGSLRVGAEQCLGLVDVSALLSTFHQRHPGVATEFAQCGSHELVSAVREGELDVAFVATDRHLGALRHTFLGGEPLVLIAPPEHELARRSTLRWEMLDGADFVDFSETWGVRTMNDDLLGTHGVHRRVRCSVNDVHTLLDLVTRGLGIAIVPEHVAAKPQAASLVTRALPGAASPSWSVSAISPLAPAADVPSALLLELLGEIVPCSDVPCCETEADQAASVARSGASVDALLAPAAT